MSGRELGRVLLKVLGVYWAVAATVSAVSMLFWIRAPSESFEVFGSRAWFLGPGFATAAVYGLASWLLVAKGDALAERLFPEASAALETENIRALVHAGVAIVGVALVVTSVSNVLRLLVEILWYSGADRRDYFWDQMSMSLPTTGYAVVAMLTGVAVAWYAGWIASLVLHDRRDGTRETTEDADPI